MVQLCLRTLGRRLHTQITPQRGVGGLRSARLGLECLAGRLPVSAVEFYICMSSFEARGAGWCLLCPARESTHQPLPGAGLAFCYLECSSYGMWLVLCQWGRHLTGRVGRAGARRVVWQPLWQPPGDNKNEHTYLFRDKFASNWLALTGLRAFATSAWWGPPGGILWIGVGNTTSMPAALPRLQAST